MDNTNFNTQEFINSGILELYIAGVLSDAENIEIYDLINKHPEIQEEVHKLEENIISFTSLFSPTSFNLKLTDLDLVYIQILREV